MSLEWDPKKASSNLKKHGVRFTDAFFVLEDPQALTIDDPDPTESRHRTVGVDSLGRVLVVSYTWRGDRLRIISVRKATPSERGQYESGS